MEPILKYDITEQKEQYQICVAISHQSPEGWGPRKKPIRLVGVKCCSNFCVYFKTIKFIVLNLSLFMKKLILLALISLLLTSCGASKKSNNKVVNKKATTSNVSSKRITKIIQHAKTFEGTRYKFGGTDRKGMDCSGLVFVSFRKENIELPRVSRDMAKQGTRVKLNQTEKGDLVFFKTNKNRKTINHVGLVVENKKGVIRFIHSSSSRGVIVSSLSEKYWKNAFIEVRRII